MSLHHELHDAHRMVSVRARNVLLEGDLAVPEDAQGIVLFAHGSGSSRHSPRNRFVAQSLRTNAQVATLLFDLLSPAEEALDAVTGELRFDIALLAERLASATDWVREEPGIRDLRIGYFGASTGAGAALVAAAIRPDHVRAIVSRGGRPDLAGAALTRVRAPTLLIVGGEDHAVIEMNRAAQSLLRAESALEIVPNATHLFEEPGALEDVARRASRWFRRFLPHAATHATTSMPR